MRLTAAIPPRRVNASLWHRCYWNWSAVGLQITADMRLWLKIMTNACRPVSSPLRFTRGNAPQSVWLWAPASLCLQRISPGSRPLLGGGDPQKKAEDLLGERIPLYGGCADLVISATGEIEAVAEALYEEIGSALGS